MRFISLVAWITLLASGPSLHAQTYSYDTNGRLTQVTYADGTTISRTYDSAGNVLADNVTPEPPATGGGGGGDGGGGGGCFIATAAYGSALHPHVGTLRKFRDDCLLTNPPGSALVEFYYATSPPIAAVISRHEWLRSMTRMALVPVVYSIAFPRTAASLALLVVALGWLRRRRRLHLAAPLPAPDLGAPAPPA